MASGQQTEGENEAEVLILKETKWISALKYIVVITLFSFGSMATFMTLRYSRRQEEARFEEEFMEDAHRMIECLTRRMARRLWLASSLSISLTSYAKASHASWPFVSLPDFDMRAFAALHITNSSSVVFAPLVRNESRWMWESFASRQMKGRNMFDYDVVTTRGGLFSKERRSIFKYDDRGNMIPEADDGPYSPVCQVTSRRQKEAPIFYNQFANPILAKALQEVFRTRRPVLSDVLMEQLQDQNEEDYEEHTEHSRHQKQLKQKQKLHDVCVIEEQANCNATGTPRQVFLVPIFDSLEKKSRVVGTMSMYYRISNDFRKILRNGHGGVTVVFDNDCGQKFSFLVQDQGVYLGEGDKHDRDFTHMEIVSSPETMHEYAAEGIPEFEFSVDSDLVRPLVWEIGRCNVRVRIYPTKSLRETYLTQQPEVQAFCVFLSFAFAALIFLFYDTLVERRQSRLMDTAHKSKAIVQSLFPKVVREKMLNEQKNRGDVHNGHNGTVEAPKVATGRMARRNSMSLLARSASLTHSVTKKDGTATPPTPSDISAAPIAELFPNTTVMFADIAGFTAWSSQREPHQVFQLLETLYRAFDDVAKKLGVFKVETIGDCYVAATGVPEPMEDHAIVMAHFAQQCLQQMGQLTKDLEISLGPGTSDLALRIGLHSGPVTAGVLRGEKSRFQLFGDTMNTASRMESTGQRNLIQVSQTTADMIITTGKQHWLTPRVEQVMAKGKGKMQTYWLKSRRRESIISSIRQIASLRDVTSSGGKISTTDTVSVDSVTEHNLDNGNKRGGRARSHKTNQWGLENGFGGSTAIEDQKEDRLIDWNADVMFGYLKKVTAQRQRKLGSTVAQDIKIPLSKNYPLSEVTEVIALPGFDKRYVNADPSLADIHLSVKNQLRDYVGQIAFMYSDHPFHNFEHASHVAMSANKLIKRMIDINADEDRETELLHKATFGISSDPLTQFAIIFAAVIHDVDHSGVPNTQLIKEGVDIAKKYSNKSVAEQNSVEIAWELLMESRYDLLRPYIYRTEGEGKRFRQLVVNAVMATDIMDKEQQTVRKKRWEKAFIFEDSNKPTDDDMNRRATAVIEHIIQASDVAHTMQHWKVYCKWNAKLYMEMADAFVNGRATKDPSEGWYNGELWFFDNYIIPLAKKLQECGVFGVAGDEYLQYALENRKEWEEKGHDVCKQMKAANEERQEWL